MIKICNCKHFDFIGVPETIRTSDPFLRREVLYPAELRGLIACDTYSVSELKQ